MWFDDRFNLPEAIRAYGAAGRGNKDFVLRLQYPARERLEDFTFRAAPILLVMSGAASLALVDFVGTLCNYCSYFLRPVRCIPNLHEY